MAETVQLTPEQEAEFNRQTGVTTAASPANTVQLTPEQQSEFRRQTGTFDPILDFSPDQIASLAKQDPEGFDLVSRFVQNRNLYKDPAIAQKAADALDLIEKQTSVLSGAGEVIKHPIKTVFTAGKTGLDAAKNMGKILWRSIIEGGTALGATVGEKLDVMAGVDPEKTAEVRREAQRKVAEAWSGIESSTSGIAMQAARIPEKLTGGNRTPEEKVSHLFKRAGEVEQLHQVVKGKGEFLTKVGEDTIKELSKTGHAVDPVVASELASGDPFVWWAFGKAFSGLGRAVPLSVRQAGAVAGEKVGAQAAVAGGKILEGMGETTRAAGAAVRRAAPVVAPAAGLVTGLVKGGPVGALAGLKGAEIAGKAVSKGAELVEKAGVRAAEVGKQVAGVTPVTLPVAQAARDVLQTLPSAAGEVAKGAALDIGLAALTAETPADLEHMVSVGTALGTVGAGRRIGGRVISGQLIAPRAWGSRTPIPSSGQYPTLDAMHSDSIRNAPPGVVERLNAIRQFAAGAAPGTDVFFGKDSASIEKGLIDAGVNPETARLYSQQEGFFTAKLPGADGQPRRVIVVKNIDAAPHESFHAFQDVLGEGANRGIDEVIKRVYSDQWENLGQSYARRLGMPEGGDWRSAVLEASGLGRAQAIEKIVSEIEGNYLQKTGSPAPEGYAERMAAEQWKRALNEIKTQNPEINAAELQREAWRGILDESETQAVADRYLARELAAENFDAAFKNLGPSLQQQRGVIPWFARIIAKTAGLMGAEPLAGRESEIGRVPLRTEAVEAVTGAVPRVEPTTAQAPTVSPRTAAPKIAIPATPEAKQQAAQEARDIAAAAPETIPAGGQKSTREILGDIAEAIAQQIGVKLNYLSALNEPAASISSNRKTRRAMIEIFRSMPASARALWEKNFFPERLIQTSKGIQVLGWAPEVFAANAHKTAQALRDKPGLSPYPIDAKTGSFTEDGWRQLYEDTQKFVANQVGGRTGAGESLVVPQNVIEAGFYKPPVIGPASGLEQRKADFINLLFGIPLPKTPRITKGKLPRNIAAQEVSAATKPGRISAPVEPRKPFGGEAAEQLGISGREISEINPLRAEIEHAGIKLPGLIEAIQRLDANSIREVQTAPEQPQFRGNEFTLSAGFQPSKEPRAIKSAAVREEETGKIFEGKLHFDATNRADEAGAGGTLSDGYVTNSGEFLNREQAYQRALELEQISRRLNPPKGELEGQLQPVAEEQRLRLQPGQRRIEIVGPDGKIYPARFDGYQEEWAKDENTGELVPKGHIAQITPEGGLPWQGNATRSTTYEPALTERGFKIVDREKLPTPDEWLDERNQPGAMFQPNADVQKVADDYAKSVGKTFSIGIAPRPVNVDLAKRLAAFYDTARHNPDDPAVKSAYDALADETIAQLDAIQQAGYTIEPWTGKGEPYKNSAEMTADVADNKHLYYLPSGGEMKSDNLMAAPAGVEGFPTINDVFRAVHDFFGHAAEGYQFGPKGELAAWNAHSQMYSDEAQPALAAETLAQNSWVNYGKHLFSESGELRPEYAKLPDRPFAEQKNVTVPAKLIGEAKSQFQPRKTDDYKFQKSRTGFSKVWITPEGKPIQLGGVWHDAYIRDNPEFAAKYKLDATAEGEENKRDALRKGFARINYDNRSGLLTIEARARDWRKLKPSITDLIDKNLDDVDRVSVFLMDDGVTKVVDSAGESLFNFDTDAEKMQNLPFITKGEEIRGQFQPEKKIPKEFFDWSPFARLLDPEALIPPAQAENPNYGNLSVKDLVDQGYKTFDWVSNGSHHNAETWPKFFRSEKGEFPVTEEGLKKAYKEARDFEIESFEATLDEGQFQPKPGVPGMKTAEMVQEPIMNFNRGFTFNRYHKWLKDVKGLSDQDASEIVSRLESEVVPEAAGMFKKAKSVAGQFQPRAGIVGKVNLEELEGDPVKSKKVKDLSLPSSEHFSLFGNSKSGDWDWRYSPDTKKIYWWYLNSVPEKAKEMVKDYLQSKGYDVSGNGDVESRGRSVKNFDEAHGQFQPRAEQEQLFGGREALSSVELSNMTKQEIADYFPEAVIPKSRDEKIPSEITRSPLYKTSDDPVSAFADKLVEFANKWKSDPAFRHGARWYSEFTPMLKKEFGADAPVMAELLAATSPKTPPNTNFGYALDALEGMKSGRFKKIIDKFNQGMDMLAEDRWLGWYNKELKAGNIPSPPAEPTPAAFLEHWIATHDLKPRQSNGKLYGQHSIPVLQVFARRWMAENTGPKTRNFVENLLGTGDEATIDLWADRTMRRIGYEGFKDRWRILPQNGTGVSDEDFSFAQKAFRAAAERLNMKPADLQGALWFAEKSLWSDNGWGRLDLGDFRAEMEKLPLLRAGIRHRLITSEAGGKSKPAEQLKIEPR